MNPLRWARESIQRRGLLQTAKVTVSMLCDLRFDFRYGTDTVRWVDMGRLAIDSQNKARAVQYQATKLRP